MKIVVGSTAFSKGEHYLDKIDYIKFPIGKIANPECLFRRRLVNKLISLLLTAYPHYLQRKCGQCDVIHSHFAPVGWQYRKLAQQMGIPHVVSFYGFDYELIPFSKPKWKQRYQELFQSADMFICEGENGGAILRQSGCPPEKIQIARLGVDVNRIEVERRAKKPKELHLVQIAAFKEKKGHRYTIAAFIKALRSCPNMTLTLVGGERDGSKSIARREVEASGVSERITFIDCIDYKNLHSFLENYHVFIHPSHYTKKMDCEGGAPIVLLDAQATGMPIISTEHCDIPDEVIHDRTGLLGQEKDITSIVAAINRLYFMNQAEYDGFALRAREHVEEHYDIRKNAKTIAKLYDKVIEN